MTRLNGPFKVQKCADCWHVLDAPGFFIAAAVSRDGTDSSAKLTARRIAAALNRDEARTADDDVVQAAITWWETKRPVGWSRRRHVACPTINTTSTAQSLLAEAVSKLFGATPPKRNPERKGRR